MKAARQNYVKKLKAKPLHPGGCRRRHYKTKKLLRAGEFPKAVIQLEKPENRHGANCAYDDISGGGIHKAGSCKRFHIKFKTGEQRKKSRCAYACAVRNHQKYYPQYFCGVPFILV